MPTFRIYEETDSGVFQRNEIFSAASPQEALQYFVARVDDHVYKSGTRFIVMREGVSINCYLFKLVAPPQTWEVVSA
jgi:hypothetical protein